jgi:condensin complex subunit 2
MVKRSKKHSYSNLVQNDDYAEKRRRRSSIRQASDNRRTSLASVARDTFRRPGGSTESSVPLMANFEEWMKLVKDNKINQTNSWNFALIDYFHDMAVLKEGDGINFQKASYTLDGCVKIYTSRVDSVASETGKLLSGLADGGKELKNAQNENDENEEDEEDEEEKKRKQKRRKQRSEVTLASSFDQLQVKNLDLELSVDPLFRKMCSDFNEGGAKGLLLNSLAIDSTGRVVFDGQVDQQPDEENDDGKEANDNGFSNRQIEYIDLALIKEGFFADLTSVDNLSICPSLPVLQTALTDPNASEFMREIESGNPHTTINRDNVNVEFEGAFSGDIADFEDDEFSGDVVLDDHDEPELEFGVPDISMHQDDEDEQQNLGLGGDDNQDEDGIIHDADGQGAMTVLMNNVVGNQDSDIMAYFDETLRKNWAGPEHWRVQRIKNLQNTNSTTGSNNTTNSDSNTQTDAYGKAGENSTPSAEPTKKRADKQAFFIDFISEENDVDEETLFAEGSASLNMPKTQQKSKTRNLLPDDEHFSSKSLIHLFLKPKAQIFRKSKSNTKNEDDFAIATQENRADDDDILVDENFFAENHQAEAELPSADDNMDDGNDANIFGDEHGDEDKIDISQFNGTLGAGSASQGNLLLGNKKARPEYVNYAKTAKKVNIKLLKDNIWNVLDIPTDEKDVNTPEPVTAAIDHKTEAESGENPVPTVKDNQKVVKFTDMVQGLRDYYPPQQLSDLSTSFCFISLLHLANEKGLIIEDNEDNTELTIRKDFTVSNSELSA